MKKRIASFLIAMVLLLGLLPMDAFAAKTKTESTTETTTESTAETTVETTTESTTETTTETTTESITETKPNTKTGLTTSDECIALLKAEEGFSRTPYWDFTQYTVGYGTRCPDDMVEEYTQNGITKEEAEVLLRNYLASVERDINVKIVEKYKLKLKQHQFDALVLFSYNCGTSWAYETGGTFHTAIAKDATGNDLIRAFALWCSAGNQIRTYLLRRRLCEANLYINGVYSQTPPDNYCYVLYNANGGTTSPRSQGYDSDLTAKPFPVPKLAGYTFKGWYTAKTGGKKVTVLDASTKGKTLYAQWKDAEGNAPPDNNASEKNPVTVTVTGTDVNLRKGPGTNYTKVGSAKKGDKFVITEIATGSGYTWGKYDGGWIALEFTDYDTIVGGGVETTPPETTVPETTVPETTVPETTVPETTVPETTVPETTVPETTVPETTVPETTVPETTVPETTVPETTVPETTVPETTVPETTTPPETTVPETTTPPETEPEESKVTGTVNVQDWLRVRSGPGTSYSVVGYLKPKQKVEILEQKTVGNTVWGKITNGWISLDYVILDKNTDSNTGNNNSGNSGSADKVWTGKVIADELLIRSGPGTNYSIVSYLKNGASVTVTEKKSDGKRQWGKIANGWICLDYVKFNTNSSTGNNNSGNSGSTGNNNASSTKPQAVTGTVNVQEFLRVRSGPGTSYSVAGYLKPKQKVTITEQKTVGGTVWGKISKGWISLDYVILDSSNVSGNASSGNTTAQTQTKTGTITADCLRVRKGPGTNNTIVGYLYYGSKVKILETAKASDGSTWGKISTGWISMDYVK